ncbi:MAG: hypothetical protein HYY37_02575 [Candidatus Aenigmarchaeota archaeon]|nr:hypothetical protein [Candidatus Aenigmarchaeota archaeon]
MRMKHWYFVALFALVAGCSTTPLFVSEGLAIKAEVDPAFIFSDGEAKLFVDITNKDAKEYTNLDVTVFDPGPHMTLQRCSSTTFSSIDKNAVVSTVCDLKAKAVSESRVENTVRLETQFSSRLSTVRSVEVISQNEFELRKKTGTLASLSRSSMASDKNLQLDIEFSADLPLVASGRDEFMFITVRNIGNGFVERLPAGSIRVEGGLVQCDTRELTPIVKTFPRLTCRVMMPSVTTSSAHTVIVNVDYTYRVRKSIPVTIVGGAAGGAGPGGGGAPCDLFATARTCTATDNSNCDTSRSANCNGDTIFSQQTCRASLGLCCYGDASEQSDDDCRRMNRR